MPRKALIGVLLFLAIGLLCFRAYETYEWHYLSSGLKRTLGAGMDSTATQSDIASYMRDARLQVRTKRDAQVLQKFEECLRQINEVAEIEQGHFDETLKSIKSRGSGDPYLQSLLDTKLKYLQAHRAVPDSVQADIDREVAFEKQDKKYEDEKYQREEDRAKSERVSAPELYRELRVDLELPPVPQTK